MTEIDAQEDWDADVIGKEGARRPVLRPEDVEAIDQAQDHKADQREPGTPWLDEGVIRHLHLLHPARLVEAQIDDRAADPRDEAGSIREGHKPVKNLGGRVSAVEVGERSK